MGQLPSGGWMLVGIGALLIVLGLLWVSLPLPWGRLPGDVIIERERVRVYFPVVTCLVLSVLLTLIVSFVRFFLR